MIIMTKRSKNKTNNHIERNKINMPMSVQYQCQQENESTSIARNSNRVNEQIRAKIKFTLLDK